MLETFPSYLLVFFSIFQTKDFPTSHKITLKAPDFPVKPSGETAHESLKWWFEPTSQCWSNYFNSLREQNFWGICHIEVQLWRMAGRCRLIWHVSAFQWPLMTPHLSESGRVLNQLPCNTTDYDIIAPYDPCIWVGKCSYESSINMDSI